MSFVTKTWLLLLLIGIWMGAGVWKSEAACPGCTTFEAGIVAGYATTNGLTEASGLAASARNPGVLWTHNDGTRQRIFAMATNGALLASFTMGPNVDDVEDIAVGPGPTNGVSYLYVGDIGGSAGTNVDRASVKIVRIPEPNVRITWADNPRTPNFGDEETFELVYPDGRYDAETLLVDPLTADLFLLTKQAGSAGVYRANLNGLTNKSTVTLQFVRTLSFSMASGGDISADGTQIMVRREDAAMIWTRCHNETVSTALSRVGVSVPVIGPPAEPNGEAVAFLRDGTGYVTLSEQLGQPIYFFRGLCPLLPRITTSLVNESGLVGGTIQFDGAAVGYPSPSYWWLFNGQVIPGQTSASLMLSGLSLANAGLYSLVAYNSVGAVTNSANLMVRLKPDLRITEVMPVQAASPGVPTGDWWELTSFESQPVSLSGWRFNDSTGEFSDPFVISENVVIQPGESIVFVEALTPAQFQAWWGTAHLPPGLKVITYTGNGLSLGAAGDGLRLWDNMTTDPNNVVATADFGAAELGVSFTYDPVLQQFGNKSQIGLNGVLRAGAAADIGSPGRIIAPPTGPILAVTPATTHIRVEFDASYGSVYTLEVSDGLKGWTETGLSLAPPNNMRGLFQVPRSSSQQFFRVKVE